jgi:hypothetical protein
MKIMRVKQPDGTLVNIPIGMEAAASAVSTHNSNTSAHADIREQISQLSSEIATVPDYWQNALDEGVESINAALCTAGYNKSSFLFYSDAHWNANSQMSPRLLKYLYEHTGMTKTFFGGDIVYNEGTDYETMAYLWDWRNQLKGLPNHHSVVGNHDDGNNTANNLFPEKYVYGFLLSAEETPDIVRGDGLYYYIDSPAEKTRYLFLDTAYKGATTEQQTFVREALIDTHEGWHIVVVSHIWYNTIYTTTPPSVGDINPNASVFLTMFDNYNSRSGDFAECSGWVEFCIGGHTHRDYDGTSGTGIPIILVETDSRDVRNGRTEAQYKYTAGTATESSVNGIIADYDNHKIYVVRIGRGESRDITVTNYVVEYTNQLPISTGTGTAIYGGDYDGNGVNDGYQQNTRLGSDGTDRTGVAGIYATGYIPVKYGDMVYLKNCQMLKGATNNQVAFYGADKKILLRGTTGITRNITDLMVTYWGGAFDENNCLTQIKMADSSNAFDLSSVAFVRFGGNYLGADSIITVNEEIE